MGHILILERMTSHEVRHPNRHTLREPVLVQIVGLAVQVKVGLLALDPLEMANYNNQMNLKFNP